MWRGRETKVARSPRVEREREVLLARFPLPSPRREILNQRKQFPLHLTARPVATPGFFPDLGCGRGVRYQEGRGRWTGGGGRGRRFLEVVEEKREPKTTFRLFTLAGGNSRHCRLCLGTR